MAKTQEREVVYNDIEVTLYREDTEVGPITSTLAKKLLDWQEEKENEPFTKDYHLVDYTGRKIRCENNITNRPLYGTVVDNLKQEMLNRRWRFNGEPIIIGRTGLILNGQHTLIALVLSEQERNCPSKGKHWKTIWKDQEVTIDKAIVYGVDESDDIINTMDTCKPRTIADVIYRSNYFSKLGPVERKRASLITDHAIRFIWFRTGRGADAFTGRRTHAEALDFLDKHSKLLKAVQHVVTENCGTEKKISKYIPLGYAAGMMYLMAVSKTDGDVYRNKDNPSEKYIDFEYWDKAEEFFTLLAGNAPEFKVLRNALASLYDGEIQGGRIEEKSMIFAKAWKLFHRGEWPAATAKDLKLKYHTMDDGTKDLISTDDFEGIDVGSGTVPAEDIDDMTKNVDNKRKKTLEETRAKIREASEKAKKGKSRGKKGSQYPGDSDTNHESNGSHYSEDDTPIKENATHGGDEE